LPPEEFAVAVAPGSIQPAKAPRARPAAAPAETRDYIETEQLSELDWILPPTPPTTVAPFARDSDASASSRGWCTR